MAFAASFNTLRFGFITLLAIMEETHAGVFLHGGNHRTLSSSLDSPPPIDLLEELERVAGSEYSADVELRVPHLEVALEPLFMAMPKDFASKLGPAGVRYALHRFFVQRHGWFVFGLETAGEAWNSSLPTNMLREREHIREVFDKQLRHGFELRHVAILAATLESLVHKETIERVEASYKLQGFTGNASVKEEDAQKIINTYMLMYLLDLDFSKVTPSEIAEHFRTVHLEYPTWFETVEFVDGIRRSRLASGGNESAATSKKSVFGLFEEVGGRYGHWQNRDCRSLKRSLVAIEEPGTGRVPIDRFYGSTLSNTNWQFFENVAYLQQLGALDDSDPRRPRVIIPNYLNSPGNCIASSQFYSVCCIDECGALLSRIEGSLRSHMATPVHILQIVTSLDSDTVTAPVIPSGFLLSRLEDIAAHHGGRVPLHSRLFAQWLHNVYPRECPYPHLSGTTRPRTPQKWMEETGLSVRASPGEMQRRVDEAERAVPSGSTSSQDGSKKLSDFQEETLPWSTEEELFVTQPAQEEENPQPRKICFGRGLLLFGAPCSMTFFLLRVFNSVTTAAKKPKALRYNL